jgi:hypothetical protein
MASLRLRTSTHLCARIGFAVAVVAAAATTVAPTDAREAAPRAPAYHVYHQYWCGTAGRTVRYTFWPKGNLGPGTPSTFPPSTYQQVGPAIPTFPPPDRSLPHLNAYRKGASWADRKWLVFIGDVSTAAGEASIGYRRDKGRPCTGPLPGDSYDDPHKGATVLKHSTKATALRCRFTSRYAYIGVGANSHLKRRTAAVYQRNQSNQSHRPMLIRATLGVKHPAVTWNTAFCHRIALPR